MKDSFRSMREREREKERERIGIEGSLIVSLARMEEMGNTTNEVLSIHSSRYGMGQSIHPSVDRSIDPSDILICSPRLSVIPYIYIVS